ncbi:MAG: hypothetical protein LBV06_06095 [Propionibacteriaceae bacterium]|nr:hypothetical protein [Propionibacteriaceae bacterium]
MKTENNSTCLRRIAFVIILVAVVHFAPVIPITSTFSPSCAQGTPAKMCEESTSTSFVSLFAIVLSLGRK